jgi:O-antigen/teichoic acid export membrane protein
VLAGYGTSAVSIRKHTLYNLVGSFLPMGLSLLTIPLYIHLIGESRYGILALVWLLVGYFGLFDLGLGRATAQRIAALPADDKAARAGTFWTALAMNAALGVVGGLIIWPAAVYFFGHVFAVEEGLRAELADAIPWIILAVPLATVSGVLSGTLQGLARFYELNVISVLSALLTQLLPLAVVWQYGPDLALLLPAVILSRLLILSVMFQRCRRHVCRGYPAAFSPACAKRLLRYGGWVTVTSLVGPMMVILDRFVIGALMGARYVAYYTVPFQLGERTRGIASALAAALFPRMASASGAESQRLAGIALRALAAVTTPAMLLGILIMQPFLSLWISPEFAGQAAPVGGILLFGFWLNSFAVIPYTLLQASGRPHIVAQCHLAELLPYFVLLYLGLDAYGLAGAAVVFGLRVASDMLLLMFFAGHLRQGVRLLALPGSLLLCALLAADLWSPGTSTWWMVVTPLGFMILGWAWHAAPAELRLMALSALRRPRYQMASEK